MSCGAGFRVIGVAAFAMGLGAPAIAAPFCADLRDPTRQSGPPTVVWEKSPPFPASLAASSKLTLVAPLSSGGLVLTARPRGAAESDKRTVLVFLNGDGAPNGAPVPVDLGPGFEISSFAALPDGSLLASVTNFAERPAPAVLHIRRDGVVDWRRELPARSGARPGTLVSLLPLSDGGAVAVLEPEVGGDPVRTVRLAADGRVLGEDDTLKYPLMARAALMRGKTIRIFGAIAGGVWARAYDSESFRLLASGLLLQPQDGYELGWPLVRDDGSLVVPGTIRSMPSLLWFGADGKLLQTGQAPDVGGALFRTFPLPGGGVVAMAALRDEGHICFVQFDAGGRERGRYLLARQAIAPGVMAEPTGDGTLLVVMVDLVQPLTHPGYLFRLKFE